MHGLNLCEGRTCFCRNSKKLNYVCRFLNMFSNGFTLLSVLLPLPHRSPSSSLFMVFYSVSCNIDEVLTINPSANMFVFRTLTSIIRIG